MKQYIFITTFFLLFFGCEHAPKIKLTDLKFADINKEYLCANQIETTYLISKNKSLNLGGSDTFGYLSYDKKGTLLNERIREFFGHHVAYEYDSIGFVKYKSYVTDFSAEFIPTYKFIADSLLLYQFWIGSDSDTCVFKFDNAGKVIEVIEYANDDHGKGRHFKTVYEYNTSGKLLKKTVNLLISMERQQIYELEYRKGLSTQNITNYFYSDNKLKLTVTIFYFPTYPNQNYKSKTYYNNLGLRDRTIEMDTIIIRYEHRTRINSHESIIV